MHRTRIKLRTESRSADTSPSRSSRDAQNYSRPNGSAMPLRPKDDIVLNTNYGLFSPQSKAEATQSLARVMEIQRQASMMPHYSSLVWLDQFVQTRALEENTRYQQVPERSAPFENLYHDLANTAVKNNERCQPLQCPNYPRLPQKKSKSRSSRLKKISQSNETSPTRNQNFTEHSSLPTLLDFQKVPHVPPVESPRYVPKIPLATVDDKSRGNIDINGSSPNICLNKQKLSNKISHQRTDISNKNSSRNCVQFVQDTNMRKLPEDQNNFQTNFTDSNLKQSSGILVRNVLWLITLALQDI